ncbi:RDD family protein [Polyangium aurulentum]|uniref:RDD family protein n=1 Tax=Polyangium aurulentum TaxID=2567896 RepID=UPI0010AE4793|nr:RDD family protein [Polyangium aurulentum]UQA59578.1 RDD family protein [Polyangium aurulentum]
MLERAHTAHPIDTTAEIETPEHLRFHYPIAGPARRGIAYLIDFLISGFVMALFGLAAFIGGIAVGDAIGEVSFGIVLLVKFLFDWLYFVLFEMVWNGRSPGKRALDLRVVTVHGHPLRLADSFLRNLLRAADMLPWGYVVGGVVAALDGRFRRLGDMVAGTMVIVEERRAVAASIRIEPPPTDKELRSIPQRLPLSGEELEAIDLFLRRKDKLGPAREEELASMVAPIFAKRMGVRYKDATRFLMLLHFRANTRRKAA